MAAEKISTGRDCRAEFRGVAVNYRKRRRALVRLGWIGASFLVLWFVPSLRLVGFYTFLACLAAMFVGARIFLRLRCPACRTGIDLPSGKFCPECGAETIRPSRWWRFGYPACATCGKQLKIGRLGDRCFHLRFCRNCGAHVHDEGL
jgi:hypothetical protein